MERSSAKKQFFRVIWKEKRTRDPRARSCGYLKEENKAGRIKKRGERKPGEAHPEKYRKNRMGPIRKKYEPGEARPEEVWKSESNFRVYKGKREGKCERRDAITLQYRNVLGRR